MSKVADNKIQANSLADNKTQAKTPEVGDVWQNKTGRLRVYITKVDVWGATLNINIVKFTQFIIMN